MSDVNNNAMGPVRPVDDEAKEVSLEHAGEIIKKKKRD